MSSHPISNSTPIGPAPPPLYVPTATDKWTGVSPAGFTIPEKEINGRVFIHEGAYVFSPNCKRTDVEVPRYASYEVDPVARNGGKTRFRYYTTPQYYAGIHYAWMGMVPIDVPWNGVLETFADHNIPLVPTKEKGHRYHDAWTAPTTLKDEWNDIEQCFTKILGACMDQIMTADDATNVHLPSTPSSTGGFTRVHRTRDVAIRQLFHSRVWFRILLGAVIFQCSRLDTLLKMPHTPLPGHYMYLPFWYMIARERFPEVETFCSALRCWLCSHINHLEFIGMFVDLESTKFIPRGLVWYIRKQVPVWYLWTAREVAYIQANPHLSFYAPPPSLLQNASTILHRSISNPTPSFPVSPTNVINRTQNSSSSELTPASSMNAFFSIREEEDIDGVEDELKPWEHYVWKYRSDRTLVRVRTSAGEMYILRHYRHRENHTRHEIDFAPDWDLPGTLAEYDASAKNASQIRGGERESCTNDSTHEEDLDNPNVLDPEFETHYEQCLHLQFAPVTEQDRVAQHWRWDPSEMARLRFGFIPPTSHSTLPTPDTMWQQVRDWVQLTDGNAAGPCPAALQSVVPHLHAFLEAFRPKKSGQIITPSSFPSPEMWDICCQTPREMRLDPYLRGLSYIDDDHIVVGQCETEPWFLVVRTALDAVHACRLLVDGLTVTNIAFHFLDHGIPFRTMVPSGRPSSASKQIATTSEIRTENHRFAAKDYESYLKLRRALFENEGVARAAFLQGGILWRIALDVLGPPSRKLIMGGPVCGQGAEDAFSSHGWFDNELTEAEIQRLCGVYIVPSMPTKWREIFEQSEAAQSTDSEDMFLRSSTSRDVDSGIGENKSSVERYHPYRRPKASSGHGPSGEHRSATFRLGSSEVDLPYARLSWFPTPDEMNTARKGYFGHWTDRVERMYVERLKELSKDDCTPKSASQWGKEVFGSVSKHVQKGVSHGARLAVREHIGAA